MSSVEPFIFGTLGGRNVHGFYMHNENGVCIELIEYGARVRSFLLPAPSGQTDEITVGLPSLDDYLRFNLYFGAIIGRTAGRTDGRPFTLDGQICRLVPNAGEAHLHGGKKGFDRALWRGSIVSETPATVCMTYTAEHLEEGYPGNVTVTVVYRLDDDNRFSITVEGTTDRITLLDVTSHVYFNLNGVGIHSVQNEELCVSATHFLNKTPQGNEDLLLPVTGNTDLRRPRTLHELSEKALYNPIMVLSDDAATVREVATVTLPSLHRSYTLSATGSVLQVYNAWNIPEVMATNGVNSNLGAGCGLCLEPQGFPNAVHHPQLPQNTLYPEDVYRHEMVFLFTF